jgi:hypothetical protein
MRLAREESGAIFWYLDPPFFEKAHRMYRHVFDLGEHGELAAAVRELPGHWLVSYDAAHAVRVLYNDRAMHLLDMVYTARRQHRAIAGREILVSDLQLPAIDAAARRSRRIRLAVIDGDVALAGANDGTFRIAGTPLEPTARKARG